MSTEHSSESVADSIRRVGSVAFAAVAILAAVVGLGWALTTLKVVVVAGLLSAMLASALEPIARRLDDRGVPPVWTAIGLMVASVAVIATLGSWIASQAWRSAGSIGSDITTGFHQVENWLQTGPLGISTADLTSLASKFGASGGTSTLVKGLAGGAGTLAELVEGAVLAVVFSTYFLSRRSRYAEWLTQLLPASARDRAAKGSTAAFEGLGRYTRAITISGAINGVVVAIVLAVMGIPGAIPLGALAFLGGFFPVVGTITAGAVATIVAVSTKGLVAAIVMVIVTAVLHHLEIYIVAPMILGRIVRFHPAAQVAALAVGLALAGVLGLFLAGPLLTVTVTTARAVRGEPECE
jgi:putative heme transporter